MVDSNGYHRSDGGSFTATESPIVASGSSYDTSGEDPRYTAYGQGQRYRAPGAGQDEGLADNLRAIVALCQELAQDARQMVQLELNLAKTEMSEKAAQAGKSIGQMAAGGFVLYAGFLAILSAIVFGLANFIALWLSALIVGVVVAIIGYVLLRAGMGQLKRLTPAPQRTVESVKRDVTAITHDGQGETTRAPDHTPSGGR